MILVALIILLIILLISNIYTYFYNKYNPPCKFVNEYFKHITKIPKASVSELNTIDINNTKTYAKSVDEEYTDKRDAIENLTNKKKIIEEFLDENTIKDDQLLQNKKQSTNFNNSNIAVFDAEMEGIRIKNRVRRVGRYFNPTGHAPIVERDGYKSS